MGLMELLNQGSLTSAMTGEEFVQTNNDPYEMGSDGKKYFTNYLDQMGRSGQDIKSMAAAGNAARNAEAQVAINQQNIAAEQEKRAAEEKAAQDQNASLGINEQGTKTLKAVKEQFGIKNPKAALMLGSFASKQPVQQYQYRELQPSETYDPKSDIMVSVGPGAGKTSKTVIKRREYNPAHTAYTQEMNNLIAQAATDPVDEARIQAMQDGSGGGQKLPSGDVMQTIGNLTKERITAEKALKDAEEAKAAGGIRSWFAADPETKRSRLAEIVKQEEPFRRGYAYLYGDQQQKQPEQIKPAAPVQESAAAPAMTAPVKTEGLKVDVGPKKAAKAEKKAGKEVKGEKVIRSDPTGNQLVEVNGKKYIKHKLTGQLVPVG